MSKLAQPFQRPHAAILARRLREPRRFIQIVAGARQVGKTTLVQQVSEAAGLPVRFASADEPTLRGAGWIAQQWEAARLAAHRDAAILVLDEVQKAVGWSESVKRLWDEDTRARLRLKVVLLGSADQYVYFGGYPGAAPLVREPGRWRRYILDSLVETTIARDVLLLTRVDKPALLRRLFELGCRYSGQVLSYTKMLGQLHDAGNTTTLAHYLELLGGAGLLAGLTKFSRGSARQRGSSPKLQVLNTFVVRAGKRLVGIEVKSTRRSDMMSGMAAFTDAFRPTRALLVGGDGIALEEFLSRPVEHWLGDKQKV